MWNISSKKDPRLIEYIFPTTNLQHSRASLNCQHCQYSVQWTQCSLWVALILRPSNYLRYTKLWRFFSFKQKVCHPPKIIFGRLSATISCRSTAYISWCFLVVQHLIWPWLSSPKCSPERTSPTFSLSELPVQTQLDSFHSWESATVTWKYKFGLTGWQLAVRVNVHSLIPPTLTSHWQASQQQAALLVSFFFLVLWFFIKQQLDGLSKPLWSTKLEIFFFHRAHWACQYSAENQLIPAVMLSIPSKHSLCLINCQKLKTGRTQTIKHI